MSTLLVLGVIAFLIADWARVGAERPEIVVSVERIEPAAGGFVVEIRAANRGGTTAADVLVEGTIEADGTTETAQTTLDFIPGHGFRRAGLYFTRDPRRHRLELRPKGYDLP